MLIAPQGAVSFSDFYKESNMETAIEACSSGNGAAFAAGIIFTVIVVFVYGKVKKLF
jgi:hypothetical protein